MARCTPARKETCKSGSGTALAAVCAVCPRREVYEPSEWFGRIWGLYRLSRGGYPFAPNSLTVEEWLGIGEMRDAMEQLRP